MKCDHSLSLINMLPWHKNASLPAFKNKIALRNQQGDTFSWLELSSLVNHVAFCLLKQGVNTNVGIAFYSKNNIETVLLYLASIQLGVRVMGINPAFSLEKMQRLCQKNTIQFYYSPETYHIDNLTPVTLDLEKKILATDLPAINSFVELANILSLESPVTMTLTSGSTGDPKAAVHSIKCHLDNAYGVCELMNFTEVHSWLLSLPLYHVSGQGIIWRWLLAGAELHLPQSDFYDSVLQATHCSLVPTQLQRLLEYIRKNNIQKFNVKHILLGGSYIPIKLIQSLLSLGISSYSGYGMTEMASTVVAKKSDLLPGVGQLLTGRQIKLVNNEIWLKGAGLALGYWNNGNIVSFLNSEGWFATKDLGIWQNGELIILGRVDNMFISGGENIHPEEIEKIILQHHNVEQVFVFPLKDSEFGDRPIAMIKFMDDFSSKNVNALKDWLADRLEKFKQPIQYINLDMGMCQPQGQIKISRVLLQKELINIIRNAE